MYKSKEVHYSEHESSRPGITQDTASCLTMECTVGTRNFKMFEGKLSVSTTHESLWRSAKEVPKVQMLRGMVRQPDSDILRKIVKSLKMGSCLPRNLLKVAWQRHMSKSL